MIDYELAIYIIDAIFYGSVLVMMGVSWYYVAGFFISMKRIKKAPHSDIYTKFAVLVPARNESGVVGNIMNALNGQTYPKEYFDVWFIVERDDDPTCRIAEEHGMKVFVRDELTSKRKTKGFALQECIRYFKENNIKYDAYMIFDADNVMDADYLEKMNDVRQTGVEVAYGYRNFTNINVNWLTSCSAILFTYMNSFTGKNRTILFKKGLITGTGYYINASIIDECGGWIFTGMTEDTEITTYCYYHNINMLYYPYVNYYDEQSPSFRNNHNQHIRWIWGFFENRRRFMLAGNNHKATSKALNRAAIFEYKVALIPFASAVSIDFLLLIASIFLYAFSLRYSPESSSLLLWQFISFAVFLYVLLIIPAIATIGHNFNKLKMKWWMILISVLTYPLFLADLLVALAHGLFVPKARKTWTPIKHTGKIKDKRAKKVMKDGK